MKVKCLKCKHEWETKSKLIYVTCPSCQLKVKTSKKINFIKRELKGG